MLRPLLLPKRLSCELSAPRQNTDGNVRIPGIRGATSLWGHGVFYCPSMNLWGHRQCSCLHFFPLFYAQILWLLRVAYGPSQDRHSRVSRDLSLDKNVKGGWNWTSMTSLLISECGLGESHLNPLKNLGKLHLRSPQTAYETHRETDRLQKRTVLPVGAALRAPKPCTRLAISSASAPCV